jgi:hypothetical protein
MINSEPGGDTSAPPQDEALDGILRSGAHGAVLLAGLATAVVIGLWLAFYVCVFAPRGIAP